MTAPAYHHQPWPAATPPAETELLRQLRAEGLHPYRWSSAPGDVYAAHAHADHKVIFVVRGSITFGVPATGRTITVRAGGRLDLPAGAVHHAVVGPDGVVCLEAQRV